MKLKNLLVALLMIIGTTLMAQEKYEQAMVAQTFSALYISIEGKEFRTVKFAKGEITELYDVTPALREIANMRNEGWEVWNTTSLNDGTIFIRTMYFLKRKI